MQLLLRDALVFEDGEKLVLFAGVPAKWFSRPMKIENLPTHFGNLSAAWEPGPAGGGRLSLSGAAAPTAGVVLRLPEGDVVTPAGQKSLRVK